MECEGADHFSVIGELADPDSALFQAIASQVGTDGR